MQEKIQSRRSFIFSPGTDPSMFGKALGSGADIVCVELEDGVAPHDKDAARANMLAIFAEPQADDGVERIVRVNEIHSSAGRADLEAVLGAESPPPALMLPKVNTPDEVAAVADALDEMGLPIRLQIIIETNHGLENAYEIAHVSPRIDSLLFGGSTWRQTCAANMPGNPCSTHAPAWSTRPRAPGSMRSTCPGST